MTKRMGVGIVAVGILGLVTAAVTAQTKSAPYVWHNVNVTAGGFVSGIVFSPAKRDVLYARTDIGGAYRWDAKAKLWIPLNDWAGGKDGNLLGIESVAPDPSDANRVYIAAGTYTQDWAGNGAILRSANQGRTFERANLPLKMGGNEDGRSIGERLAVDPNDGKTLYFGSRHDGLWRSIDRAVTWQKVENFPVKARPNGMGIGFAIFDKSSGVKGKPTPTVYIAADEPGDATIFRSTDAGKTWSPVPGQPTGFLPHHGILSPDGNLYLTYGNAPGPNGMTDGAVWKLDTKTGNWTDITPVKPGTPAGFGYAGLTLDAQNPKIVMVSTMDRWNPGDTLFRSLDSGKSWEDLGPKSVRDSSLSPFVTFGAPTARLGWWLGALALDPFRPGHVLYGTGATIWGSDDATNADKNLPTHWAVAAPGLEETAVICLISPPSGAHLVSGLGDIGGFRHDDLTVSPRGGMWTNPSITNTDSLDFAAENPTLIVRVGRGERGKNGAISRDGASTWTPFPAEPTGSRGSGSVAISSDGKTLIWAANGAPVSRSTDDGATWTPVSGIPAPAAGQPRGGARVSVISDRVNPSDFYVLTADFLFVSHDSGVTFSRLGIPPLIRQIRATPGKAGDIWLTAGGDGLWHLMENTWVKVGGVHDAQQLGFGKAAPGRDYPAMYLTGETAGDGNGIGGASAVYRSDDAGKTWVRLNDDAHQWGFSGQAVTGDPRIYGRVYMGSNGRGVLYGEPGK